MKRSLSSRTGLLSIVTLAGLAAAAACSSSTTGSTPPPNTEDDGGGENGSSSGNPSGSSSGNPSGSSSGNPSGSSSGAGSSASSSGVITPGNGSISCPDGGFCTIENTADGGCPTQMTITLGVHIHFEVSWPSSTAAVAGNAQPVDIWLVSEQMGNTMFTGTAKTCGTTLPPIVLSSAGFDTICPSSANGNCPMDVQIAFNNSIWDSISRTFNESGTQTGWNPGDTLTTTPSLGVLGLKSTAAAAAAGGTWPSNPACIGTGSCACMGTGTGASAVFSGTCGAFAGSDISDDDGDGHPGITANPLSNTTYTLPPTSIAPFDVPPEADQVYIVSRNQIALTGMRMNSCTQGSGTASITLFDNHVVGCHATASTDGPTTAGPCTDSEVGFLDGNRTIYGASNGNAASTSNAISGTVTIQQMGPNPSCAEVRTIN